MSDKVTLFFEAWELFREPTLAGACAGATLGLVGVWIVLRGMVFLSATLSQVAGLGVAAALVAAPALGFSAPGLGAVVFTLLAALSLSLSARSGKASADATLGVLFLAASSGTLLLASRTGTELSDIDSLLFGSAVAVMPAQFRWLVAVCLGVLVLHLWWWRGFAAVTADADEARVRGLPTRSLELRSWRARPAVGVATWVLGALPTFAFLCSPRSRRWPSRPTCPSRSRSAACSASSPEAAATSRRSSPTPPWARRRPPSRSRSPSSRRSPVVAEARYVDAQSLQAP